MTTEEIVMALGLFAVASIVYGLAVTTPEREARAKARREELRAARRRSRTRVSDERGD